MQRADGGRFFRRSDDDGRERRSDHVPTPLADDRRQSTRARESPRGRQSHTRRAIARWQRMMFPDPRRHAAERRAGTRARAYLIAAAPDGAAKLGLLARPGLVAHEPRVALRGRRTRGGGAATGRRTATSARIVVTVRVVSTRRRRVIATSSSPRDPHGRAPSRARDALSIPCLVRAGTKRHGRKSAVAELDHDEFIQLDHPAICPLCVQESQCLTSGALEVMLVN